MRISTILTCLVCGLLLGSCREVPYNTHPSESACLLIPTGEMPPDGWPAVLLLHDHGARYEKGWRKVIGDTPEPYYHGIAIGESLAAHGYVVYCADALYWGARGSSLSQREFSDSIGAPGEWYRRVLADDKAGIGHLRALPCVDSSRIAVAGFSYGAYRAWNLAAEDMRVKVCIASHWMTTLAQNRYNDSWLSMYRPGLYPLSSDSLLSCRSLYSEFSSVAASIAPRPFLLQYGTNDRLFPLPAVDSCIHHIDSVYQHGVFRPEAFPCGHEMTHDHLTHWLHFLKEYL